jgi:hypothetical protein
MATLNCRPPLNGVNARFELSLQVTLFICHERVILLYIASKCLPTCLVALCALFIWYYRPKVAVETRNCKIWIFLRLHLRYVYVYIFVYVYVYVNSVEQAVIYTHGYEKIPQPEN